MIKYIFKLYVFERNFNLHLLNCCLTCQIGREFLHINFLGSCECVDEFDNNECEHVNFVSNNNVQRFDNQKGQWNRNYQNQGNFDNYNHNGGYRNQGNQGSRGSHNN